MDRKRNLGIVSSFWYFDQKVTLFKHAGIFFKQNIQGPCKKFILDEYFHGFLSLRFDKVPTVYRDIHL